ncbi:MAG TPA: hypothetical protein VF198_12020 [Vicinamibacterales bacterium]
MRLVGWIAAGVLGLGAAASAQDVASVASVHPDQMRVRFQIAAMEGVLETAVQLGAKRLIQQVQAVSPDMLIIGGAARARGFLLDGYGVFFDVDVPAMRRSIAWSFRTLDRADRGLELAAQTIRRHMAAMRDPGARREVEEALQRIVRTAAPAGGGAGVPVSGQVQGSAEGGADAPAGTAAADASSVLDDPGLAYTNEVKAALIDAMLEYGGASIPIGENEWLTVAARDSESRLGVVDRYDVSTIVLRVRGADLAAFRAGRLTKEAAVERVEISEY